MYAVVGCSTCEAIWIVETGAEDSQCPRCGTTRPLAKRAKLATAEDRDRARDHRTALLAERRDAADAPSFSALADAVETAGPDEDDYLAASGVDPAAAAAAGERAAEGAGGSRSQRAVVEAALEASHAAEEGDGRAAPTEEDVVAYATARGVPAERARTLLAALVEDGAVVEADGRYRSL